MKRIDRRLLRGLLRGRDRAPLAAVRWLAVALLPWALMSTAFAQRTSLMDGMPKNGLSSQSFLHNALTTNPDALAILRQQPLGAGLIADPVINLQLNERGARAVMEEIVKCALTPASKLTYVDALHHTYQWQGQLGLCQHADTEVGDWSAGAPTPACQELITACLMARVNGLGMSIPLSLHGRPAALFPSRAAVVTEENLREPHLTEDPAEGTPIESFAGPLCVAGHECRWATSYVGKCTGGRVALAIDSPTVCSTTPIRVCAGLHGCYGPGSPVGYPSTVPYSKHLKGQGGACVGATLEFDCPVAPPIGGYYSVMTQPRSTVKATVPVSPPVRKVSGPGSFPATEAEAFSYVEGAFYGNLFVPEELAVRCAVNASYPTVLLCGPGDGGPPTNSCTVATPGACLQRARWLPYRNVYACYALTRNGNDPDDAEAVAYLNDRICAQRNPAEPCFPHPPRRCNLRCEWDADGGLYQQCRGREDATGASVAYRPITTSLNDPCDLIGDTAFCARVRQQLVTGGSGAGPVSAGPGPGSAGPGGGGHRPRGCGGCASTASPGSSAAVALALLLAIGGRGSRRR